MDWKNRKERIEALLDVALQTDNDNPIYEQYTSRNIMNYLTAIKQINEIVKTEKGEG